MQIDEFFSTAIERERIRRRRLVAAKWPWTDDEIFQTWRFCNVHRENDKTTVWFRNHIRSKHEGWKLVRATFVFRWFNRIEVGEIIEDLLYDDKINLIEMKSRLKYVKPVTNSAYIISTPEGLRKLDGILSVIENSLIDLHGMYEEWSQVHIPTLVKPWLDLCELYYLGPFMSYEIVTDLRHTPILHEATDIMTWANAGPGCARGLGRLVGKKFNRHRDQPEMLEIMAKILEASNNYWPKNWEPWEMREVEHWLCEANKYCNAKEGRRLKRRYSYEATT